MGWMVLPLKRYVEFSGRSRRKEYWLYTLFIFIVGMIIAGIEEALGIARMIAGIYGPASALLAAATLIPGLAVAVRRLHDIDRTGWWLLLEIPIYGFVVFGAASATGFPLLETGEGVALVLAGFVSMIIAALVLLVFCVTDGTQGPNRFGSDPKDPHQAEVFA
jgi:uncharacterized membrane protein YhaH (DUF805 family)